MRRCGFLVISLAFAIAACSKTPNGDQTVLENQKPAGNPGRPSPSGLLAKSGGMLGSNQNGTGPLPSPIVTGFGPATGGRGGPAAPDPQNEPSADIRYRAALTKAMEALGEKRFEDALAGFQAAGDIKTTDQATQWAKEAVKRRLDAETAAEQTTANIQAVLDEGRAEEASKLGVDALLQFGHTESLERLIKLKREADTLATADIDSRKARFDRFRKEYDDAIKNENNRAAVIALEQALQNGDDAALSKTYDELQRNLTRYDELRAQANEAHQDPSRLPEAITATQAAQKIWNSLAIREELEQFQIESQLVALNSRERLAIAEFEVRGDIGLPQAGEFVADELLPQFKTRFQLVERSQLDKAAEELNVQSEALINDPEGGRQLSRAVKARYLVVGSLTAINGITVQARLIDVDTGLIVQTAKIVAQTPEELTQRLPRLAEELQMSDIEKREAEQEQLKEAAPVEELKPADDLKLPPPPEPLRDIPPPVIPPRPKPPAVNLVPEQLDNLPPPPPPNQVLALPVLSAARDLELRRRTLLVSLELGDNLFRRGRFRDALRHFEFALNLFPELPEVRLRVERCRPLAPPVVVLPGRPVLIARPRLAVLDFMVVGNALVVPPYLGWWTPENLAPYFGPEYQVVDRSELFWWMGRLGITPRDLLTDPAARLYLARALNARYFLFGNLTQTSSFNVTTYLVDAEYGFLVSSARIHVRWAVELKSRLSELAWLTKMTPVERRRVEKENPQWLLLMNDIRQRRERNQYFDCMKLCEKALVLRPGNVEVSLILRETSERYRREKFEERPQNADLINSQANAVRRQLALAREAEQARLQAEALGQARSETERRRIQRQREAAAERLAVQARLLVQAKQYAKAVNVFESAAALRPNHDVTIREMALARAKVEETRRANLAEAQTAREAAQRRQREQELARVRAQLEVERKQRKEAEQARLRSQEERDRRESDRLIALAQQLSAKQEFDQAVAAAQTAKRLRPTPEAERLVSQLLIDLARSNAEKKGAAAKAELERQLDAERKARSAAEASAAKSQQLYERAMVLGQQFLKARKLAEAEEQFQTARRIHQTDAVLSGLKQVQTARAQAEAKLEAERRQEAELKRQADELKQQLAAAQAALAAKQVDTAVKLFREAKKLAPSNVEVLTGLAKAEQLRDQALAAARKQGDEKAKRDLFQRFLSGGKANLSAKKYEAASLAFGEALKLFPNDKDARDGLAAANSKLVIDESSRAEMKNRATKYQDLMSDGRRFLAAKQFDRALQAFHEASNLARGDKAVEEAVQEALRLKTEAEKIKAEETRKAKANERKAAEIAAALGRFHKALSLGKLDEAATAYRAAAALDARHPEVIKAQAELRKAQDAAEAARNAAMQSEQQKQEFAKFMAQAKTALQANRFDEAAKAVGSALALAPNDKDARALQAQINQEKANAALMAQKRQQFTQLMQHGRAAMAAKEFADAVKAFESAKALFPTDATVVKALADATKALNASKAPAKPMGKPTQYTRQMDQGAALEKAGQYDRALAAYKAALQLAPNDADADKKVDFCQFMADGGQAMKARKFADARAAFENALKLFPSDTNAKSALQRAKAAK